MSILTPLKLQNLILENNLLQAPLAGYSSLPFRLLTWRLGRPGMLATEMISARAIQMGAPQQKQYLAKSPSEGNVSFQLWGNDVDAIAIATKVAEDHGANAVDLNCGCPVKKVRAAGAGSKLLENPPLIGKLVSAMRRATTLPISIKIRVGTNENNYNGIEVAKIAENAGVDFLIVHGRHAAERYSHPVRYEKIAEIVSAIKIPVIGNGDVVDGASAKKMLATGCVGVMVGRACMGAPWIFAKIKSEMSGEIWSPPTRTEMAKILLEHYDLLCDLIGAERAIRQTRKLGSFYSKGLFGAKDFRNHLNYLQNRDDLVNALTMLASCEAQNINQLLPLASVGEIFGEEVAN